MAKKKPKRTTRPIVSGYLERVSALVLEKYKSEIAEMIQGHQGLYALYRRNKLYYVGLVSDLRRRINRQFEGKVIWIPSSFKTARERKPSPLGGQARGTTGAFCFRCILTPSLRIDMAPATDAIARRSIAHLAALC